jgi:hypothetical protein
MKVPDRTEGVTGIDDFKSDSSEPEEQCFFKTASDVGSSFIKCSLFGDHAVSSEY